MSNNNFQALFSTFKAALGTDSQEGGRLGGGESKTSDVGERNLTVKERIHQQWRITQIQQARPSSSSPKRDTVKKVKVAICAVIVDSLKYEEIWRKWQSSSKSSECKFIVHAKYPERIRSPWLRRHTLPFSHRPNWNDVRVVKAMIDTLKEAVKDDDVTHTVFVTESCLPISPYENLVEYLDERPHRSFIAYHDSSSGSRFDELEIWSKLTKVFPLATLHKALPGWITMCRNHVEAVLKLEYAVDSFENIWAPEEVYFPTMLCLAGKMEKVSNKTLTHSRWPSSGTDKAHPYEYSVRRSTFYDWLRDDIFFARKFVDDVSVRRWYDIIEENSKELKEKRRFKRRAQDSGTVIEDSKSLGETPDSFKRRKI